MSRRKKVYLEIDLSNLTPREYRRKIRLLNKLMGSEPEMAEAKPDTTLQHVAFDRVVDDMRIQITTDNPFIKATVKERKNEEQHN